MAEIKKRTAKKKDLSQNENAIPELIEYAERMYRFRKYKRMPQWEFAEILGVSQPAIVRYENAMTNIPIEVVAAMRQKLNMSLEWFYFNTGGMDHIEKKGSTLVKDMGELQAQQMQNEIRIRKLEENVRYLSSLINRDKISH